MTTTRTDNWFLRRIMKLTRLERKAMNSPKHARHTERTALTLLEHVSLPPQPHCLEIGCGQGALARLLVERYGAQVIASDYDRAQVALTQEWLADLGEHVEVRVVDARSIPFNDTAFDAVFSFGVLHHIPGGWREVVAETARVLRPGGWFVFTDLIITPRVGRLTRRILPKMDQLEEAALHACLAESGLGLEYYAYDHKEHISVLGAMVYCTAVARRKETGPTEKGDTP